MSTYLCPSCQGRREVGVFPTFGDTACATSTTTCLTCGGTGSIGAPEPKTEWEYDATCERCGMGRRFALAVPPDQLDPIMVQMLAGQIGCPRAPRICGTLKLTEVQHEDVF